MKELSIEEKAKAYDEAIKRIKGYVTDEYGCTRLKPSDIFPELAKSEDEKIRKEIINFIATTPKAKQKHHSWITWLEKQGESIKIKKGKNYLCTKTHKYAGVEWREGIKYYSPEDYSLVNQGCTCYCPKYSKEEHNNFFKEVEYDGCLEKQCEQKKVFKSDEMTTLEVKLSSLVVDAVHIYCKENKLDTPHFVGLTLGDRLAKEWSKEILESAKKEFEEIESKPTDKVEPKFHEGDIIIHKELGGDYIHNPHKIIQVDILDKKYRLEGGLVAHFGEQEDYELVEQKPAWSEEDEKMRTKCAACLGYYYHDIMITTKEYKEAHNWLNSLKDRVQPKQEWSKEDEKGLGDALWCCNQAASIAKDENDMGNCWYAKHWLKSLRPQKQWKPTEEQMKQLHKYCIDNKPLNELYEQLKEL